MAADEDTPKEPESGQIERQVSSLLDYLQTPMKQVQQWVSSGQLQSTIRALDEVRQGVQIHVKKQLQAYQQQTEQRVAEPAPPVETEATSQPRPKAKGSGKKKASGKKSSRRKP